MLIPLSYTGLPENLQTNIMMAIANNNYPLVSIVLATYNGEKFLEEQLDSIVRQTYPNIEIIAVDDCSSDKTVEILRKYALEHKNFRVVVNDVNLGYVKNFEKACTLATGEYISFCDQDDVWDLEKTALLMGSIGQHPVIYCDSAFFDADLHSMGRNHSDLKNLASYDNCLYFATDNCVGGHAMIMQRNMLDDALPFPVEMPYDLWLAFVATFRGEIKYFNQPFVKWRQHGGNVTMSDNDKQRKIGETRKRLKIFYNYCPPERQMEKKVLRQLSQSFQSYSPANNFSRMMLFFNYKKYLLGMKKRSELRKFLFCIKMFFKIRLHVA